MLMMAAFDTADAKELIAMASQLRDLDIDLITRGHLEKGLESLREEFAGTFSAETIERYLVESVEALSGARFKNFVPLLVHRFARERLRALAQVEGKLGKDVPEVLFVCVHNAGRSQMAAALLDHYAKGKVHVRSAGSTPAEEINPEVVTAMAELGLDLSQEFPKPMTDEFVQAADVVITMGCGDACPIYPGKRYEDWELDDPADADLERRPAHPRRDRPPRRAPRRRAGARRSRRDTPSPSSPTSTPTCPRCRRRSRGSTSSASSASTAAATSSATARTRTRCAR